MRNLTTTSSRPSQPDPSLTEENGPTHPQRDGDRDEREDREQQDEHGRGNEDVHRDRFTRRVGGLARKATPRMDVRPDTEEGTVRIHEVRRDATLIEPLDGAPPRGLPHTLAERRSWSSRVIASVSAEGDRGATRSPSTPGRTTSRHPLISVRTSGFPIAAASMADRGIPSLHEASTNTSMRPSRSRTSSRHPVKITSTPAARSSPARRASAFRRVGIADSEESHLGVFAPDPARRVEELPISLLRNEPADRSHHEFALIDPQLAPKERQSLARNGRRFEVIDISSIPQEHRLRAASDVQSTCYGEILGALVELKIAAPRGDPFCAQNHCAFAQPILRRRVEPVHRVGHMRNPAESSGDAPHHPRLRIVGVHEVEALPPEDRDQLAERARVGSWTPGSSGVMPRDVPHALRLDLGHTGSRLR